MKSNIISLLLLSMFFTGSCEKEEYQKYGFSYPFKETSRGEILMMVEGDNPHINLHGTITVNNGAMEVKLISPDGVEVFTRRVINPGRMVINQVIEATPGMWTLTYQSINGSGSIELHAFI